MKEWISPCSLRSVQVSLIILLILLVFMFNFINFSFTTKEISTEIAIGIQHEYRQQTSLSEKAFDSSNSFYCEVKSVGCFAPASKINGKLTLSTSYMTRSWCFAACSSWNSTYAGLQDGKKCVCSRKGVNVLMNISRNRSECNIPCPGNANETCGGKNQVEVFQIKTACFDEAHAPLNFEESRFLGCHENTSVQELYSDQSASNCILHCTKINMHLALWNWKKSICSCESLVEKIFWTKNLSECNEFSWRIYKSLSEAKYCKPIRLLSPQTKVKKFMLGSTPGAGNTWVRHLIELASGIYTGSIYNDFKLYNSGFLGETLNQRLNQVFVVKTHVGSEKQFLNFDGSIIILRNPFKTALAEWNRRGSRDHTGHVNNSSFMSLDFKKFSSNQRPWYELIEQAINSQKPFHFVFFENLLNDLEYEVRNLMKFLEKYGGFKQSDLDERLLCLKENSQGSFKRKSQQLKINPFSLETTKKYIDSVATGRKLLSDANLTVHIPNYEAYFT